jgi:peptidoglycan/xylan/chitin deacetylase (PgdA/CDA1 family)
MGGKARRGCLVAAACCCAAQAGCGESTVDSSDPPAARIPAPAPRVVLSATDREVWAPGPPDRSVVPVLLYHGVAPVDRFSNRPDADLGIDPEVFARQMVLLDHAGYETITLDEFVRFIGREQVSLPPRPLLLTFDGGRLDSWTGSDGILRELGFNAALFVDVGRVEAEDPEHLTWKELNSLQRSGRWEVQLQAGTGHQQIRYGPAPDDVGPFYAYRGSEEVLGGWRERVFSDITYGEEQLSFRVRGYRPLAFAPPYGNYGQAGTNDRRIPRELLARLLGSFEVVFTQDRPGFASPGAGTAEPVGRIEITRQVTEGQLHSLLVSAPGPSPDREDRAKPSAVGTVSLTLSARASRESGRPPSGR